MRRDRPQLSGPTEPFVQLATRVPRELRRRVRLVCVQQNRSVQTFVAETLREHLRSRQRA